MIDYNGSFWRPPFVLHRAKGWPLLFLLLLLFQPLYAQEEGELNRQIRLVKEEIQREKALRQRENERDVAFQKTAKERLKRLQNERAIAVAQAESLQVELKRVDELRLKQRATARWYGKRHDDHRKFLARYVDSTVAFVQNDFPYNQEERLRSLKSLKELLEEGSISPEEGTDRLWGVWLSLLKLGGSVENWPGSLMSEQGELSGRYLRLGAVWMGFVSDDGRQLYLLSPADAGWRWRPLHDESELRAALRQALKVSEGKRAPALVLLPIDNSAVLLPKTAGGER